MKIARFAIVAAVIVAALALLAWFLRDGLIQQISNPLLQDYDITVTDVSLDALASSDASISHLELVYDERTTIIIKNLTLPIGATPAGSKIYRAEKVSVTVPTGDSTEPLELASIIERLLALPDDLAGSVFIVTELEMQPYPTVRDMQWALRDSEQSLTASVDSIVISATITRTGARDHAVAFSLPAASTSDQDHVIDASLHHDEQHISLSGSSLLNLPAWNPIAKLAGIVPAEIDISSGAGTLRFDVQVPHDSSRSPSVTADLTPLPPWQLGYSQPSGEITSILVASGEPVELAATFPVVDWSLNQPELSLLVSYGAWQEIPFTINNLSCTPGPVCSLSSRLVATAAELPIGTVDRLAMSSIQEVVFSDDAVRVTVQPGAALTVDNLSAPDTKIGGIDARLVSGATLELVDAGWKFSANSLDGNIHDVTVGDMTVTTPLFLEDVALSELDQVLAAKTGIYAPSSQAVWNKHSIALPGFKGSIALQDANITTDQATVGLYQDGRITAQHNLDTGTGSLSVGETIVSFGAQKLSERVTPWRKDWDLSAGSVAFDLQAGWGQSDSGLRFDGQVSTRITSLTGNYDDIAFAGLTTTLESVYRNASGFTVEPSTISIALIEIGLPIENVSASYALNPDTMAVEVEQLHMSAFGGVIRADPFSFHAGRDRNTLTLTAESVELNELLTLKEFEALQVSGSIGAELPVTIEKGMITIAGGKLNGDLPGGVIRYLPGSQPDEDDTSSIATVRRALSNFEYDTLTSAVDFSKAGDLNLRLRLTGRNPDMDENRPVVLNLTVENNVPQMLRSLRAARAVEEILEERLSK